MIDTIFQRDLGMHQMENEIEKAFDEGIDEGIAIERERVIGLVQEYINGPDVTLDMLLEWINES